MPLDPFTASPASPGQPVTAQAWNELVNGLANVVAFLESSTGSSLAVNIGNADADPAATRVASISDSGAVVEATRPIGNISAYTLRGLAPGAYTIRAESPGFKPAETSVTLPSEAPVTLSMERDAPFMDEVFGSELQTALATLANSAIAVTRVVDITGREVPPANPGAEFASTLVLAQLPRAGAAVPPGSDVQLVVSASLEVEATVEMPSLAGLSLGEVRQVLDELGLVLGEVQTVSQ